MKLIIKILGKNEEFTISVPNNSVDVRTLKKILERNNDIPVHSQRILYKGRALADTKPIQDYGITENSKLHLSIKPNGGIRDLPENQPDSSPSGSFSNDRGDFFFRLERVLKKHFTEDDAEKILSKFREGYSNMIRVLSLDDIERIAKYEVENRKT